MVWLNRKPGKTKDILDAFGVSRSRRYIGRPDVYLGRRNSRCSQIGLSIVFIKWKLSVKGNSGKPPSNSPLPISVGA